MLQVVRTAYRSLRSTPSEQPDLAAFLVRGTAASFTSSGAACSSLPLRLDEGYHEFEDQLAQVHQARSRSSSQRQGQQSEQPVYRDSDSAIFPNGERAVNGAKNANGKWPLPSNGARRANGDQHPNGHTVPVGTSPPNGSKKGWAAVLNGSRTRRSPKVGPIPATAMTLPSQLAASAAATRASPTPTEAAAAAAAVASTSGRQQQQPPGPRNQRQDIHQAPHTHACQQHQQPNTQESRWVCNQAADEHRNLQQQPPQPFFRERWRRCYQAAQGTLVGRQRRAVQLLIQRSYDQAVAAAMGLDPESVVRHYKGGQPGPSLGPGGEDRSRPWRFGQLQALSLDQGQSGAAHGWHAGTGGQGARPHALQLDDPGASPHPRRRGEPANRDDHGGVGGWDQQLEGSSSPLGRLHGVSSSSSSSAAARGDQQQRQQHEGGSDGPAWQHAPPQSLHLPVRNAQHAHRVWDSCIDMLDAALFGRHASEATSAGDQGQGSTKHTQRPLVPKLKASEAAHALHTLTVLGKRLQLLRGGRYERSQAPEAQQRLFNDLMDAVERGVFTCKPRELSVAAYALADFGRLGAACDSGEGGQQCHQGAGPAADSAARALHYRRIKAIYHQACRLVSKDKAAAFRQDPHPLAHLVRASAVLQREPASEWRGAARKLARKLIQFMQEPSLLGPADVATAAAGFVPVLSQELQDAAQAAFARHMGEQMGRYQARQVAQVLGVAADLQRTRTFRAAAAKDGAGPPPHVPALAPQAIDMALEHLARRRGHVDPEALSLALNALTPMRHVPRAGSQFCRVVIQRRLGELLPRMHEVQLARVVRAAGRLQVSLGPQLLAALEGQCCHLLMSASPGSVGMGTVAGIAQGLAYGGAASPQLQRAIARHAGAWPEGLVREAPALLLRQLFMADVLLGLPPLDESMLPGQPGWLAAWRAPGGAHQGDGGWPGLTSSALLPAAGEAAGAAAQGAAHGHGGLSQQQGGWCYEPSLQQGKPGYGPPLPSALASRLGIEPTLLPDPMFQAAAKAWRDWQAAKAARLSTFKHEVTAALASLRVHGLVGGAVNAGLVAPLFICRVNNGSDSSSPPGMDSLLSKEEGGSARAGVTLAVSADSSNAYASNQPHWALGSTVARARVGAALGIKLISLNGHDWFARDSQEQREGLLKSVLHNAGVLPPAGLHSPAPRN